MSFYEKYYLFEKKSINIYLIIFLLSQNFATYHVKLSKITGYLLTVIQNPKFFKVFFLSMKFKFLSLITKFYFFEFRLSSQPVCIIFSHGLSSVFDNGICCRLY